MSHSDQAPAETTPRQAELMAIARGLAELVSGEMFTAVEPIESIAMLAFVVQQMIDGARLAELRAFTKAWQLLPGEQFFASLRARIHDIEQGAASALAGGGNL